MIAPFGAQVKPGAFARKFAPFDSQ